MPNGNENVIKGKNYLYKIKGEIKTKNQIWKGDKISQFYFKVDTFNIVYLSQGTITKIINIEEGI